MRDFISIVVTCSIPICTFSLNISLYRCFKNSKSSISTIKKAICFFMLNTIGLSVTAELIYFYVTTR